MQIDCDKPEYIDNYYYEKEETNSRRDFSRSLGSYGLLVLANFKIVPFIFVFPLYLLAIPIFLIALTFELIGKFIEILSLYRSLHPIVFILSPLFVISSIIYYIFGFLGVIVVSPYLYLVNKSN